MMMIMIEGEWPTVTSRAPIPDGSSPVVIFVYVEDVDQTVEQAFAGGAQVLMPAQTRSNQAAAPDGGSLLRSAA